MARTSHLLLRSYAAETARLETQEHEKMIENLEEMERKNLEKMKKFTHRRRGQLSGNTQRGSTPRSSTTARSSSPRPSVSHFRSGSPSGSARSSHSRASASSRGDLNNPSPVKPPHRVDNPSGGGKHPPQDSPVGGNQEVGTSTQKTEVHGSFYTEEDEAMKFSSQLRSHAQNVALVSASHAARKSVGTAVNPTTAHEDDNAPKMLNQFKLVKATSNADSNVRNDVGSGSESWAEAKSLLAQLEALTKPINNPVNERAQQGAAIHGANDDAYAHRRRTGDGNGSFALQEEEAGVDRGEAGGKKAASGSSSSSSSAHSLYNRSSEIGGSQSPNSQRGQKAGEAERVGNHGDLKEGRQLSISPKRTTDYGDLGRRQRSISPKRPSYYGDLGRRQRSISPKRETDYGDVGGKERSISLQKSSTRKAAASKPEGPESSTFSAWGSPIASSKGGREQQEQLRQPQSPTILEVSDDEGSDGNGGDNRKARDGKQPSTKQFRSPSGDDFDLTGFNVPDGNSFVEATRRGGAAIARTNRAASKATHVSSSAMPASSSSLTHGKSKSSSEWQRQRWSKGGLSTRERSGYDGTRGESAMSMVKRRGEVKGAPSRPPLPSPPPSPLRNTNKHKQQAVSLSGLVEPAIGRIVTATSPQSKLNSATANKQRHRRHRPDGTSSSSLVANNADKAKLSEEEARLVDDYQVEAAVVAGATGMAVAGTVGVAAGGALLAAALTPLGLAVVACGAGVSVLAVKTQFLVNDEGASVTLREKLELSLEADAKRREGSGVGGGSGDGASSSSASMRQRMGAAAVTLGKHAGVAALCGGKRVAAETRRLEREHKLLQKFKARVKAAVSSPWKFHGSVPHPRQQASAPSSASPNNFPHGTRNHPRHQPTSPVEATGKSDNAEGGRNLSNATPHAASKQGGEENGQHRQVAQEAALEAEGMLKKRLKEAAAASDQRRTLLAKRLSTAPVDEALLALEANNLCVEERALASLDGWLSLELVGTTLRLDVNGGASLVLWPRNGDANQLWRHDTVDRTLLSRLNGLVLNMVSAEDEGGGNGDGDNGGGGRGGQLTTAPSAAAHATHKVKSNQMFTILNLPHNPPPSSPLHRFSEGNHGTSDDDDDDDSHTAAQKPGNSRLLKGKFRAHAAGQQLVRLCALSTGRVLGVGHHIPQQRAAPSLPSLGGSTCVEVVAAVPAYSEPLPGARVAMLQPHKHDERLYTWRIVPFVEVSATAAENPSHFAAGASTAL